MENNNQPKCKRTIWHIIVSILFFIWGLYEIMQISSAGKDYKIIPMLTAVVLISLGIINLLKLSYKINYAISIAIILIPCVLYMILFYIDTFGDLLSIDVNINFGMNTTMPAITQTFIIFICHFMLDTDLNYDESVAWSLTTKRTQKYISQRGMTSEEYKYRQLNAKNKLWFVMLLPNIFLNIFLCVIVSNLSPHLLTSAFIYIAFCAIFAMLHFIIASVGLYPKLEKAKIISSVIALVLCVICLVLPIFTTIVKTGFEDVEKEITFKGADVIEIAKDVFDYCDWSDVAGIVPDLIKGIDEFSDIGSFGNIDDEDSSKSIALAVTAIISGIVLLVMAVLWFFQSLKELFGNKKTAYVKLGITATALIAFFGSIAILTNMWTDYMQGIMGYYAKTDTIIIGILGVLVCVGYVCINQPAIKNKIAEKAHALFEKREKVDTNAVNTQNSVETLSEKAKIDALIEYKKLLDNGLITEEEYQMKKEELLNLKK